MKALSIVSPSGSKIAAGRKTLEIRRWIPDISPTEHLLIVENSRFLREDGDEDPDGQAVAIVKVAAIRPFVESDMQAACASYFEEGWFAWELTDIRPVVSKERILAARGIYDVMPTSCQLNEVTPHSGTPSNLFGRQLSILPIMPNLRMAKTRDADHQARPCSSKSVLSRS